MENLKFCKRMYQKYCSKTHGGSMVKLVIMIEMAVRPWSRVSIQEMAELIGVAEQMMRAHYRKLESEGMIERGRLTRKACELLEIPSHQYQPGVQIPSGAMV